MKDLNLLVIEDEAAIVRVLEPTLNATVASVKFAWTGTDGVALASASAFDVVICDLGLPDMDGHDVITQIRQTSNVPIIVLSARENEDDRVRALDSGADDYVPKPFSIGELLARIRAAARRRQPTTSKDATIRLKGLELDLNSRRMKLNGEEIRLSGREHALMKLLVQRVEQVVTHKEIIEAVWGSASAVETQFVRVLVGQLRQKLEADPANPSLVCTEPGVGYRLRATQ